MMSNLLLITPTTYLSSVNKDYYRESVESLPLSVQSLGSTEYIVLPNHGKGIGIGISGKSGVIIRNILQGSIADKVRCFIVQLDMYG